MYKRRAYFVIHPEGGGGYMLTEALVAAGCHWEQRHEGYQDDYKFDEMPSPFVFHRSLPHAGKWPTSIDYCGMLQKAGFNVHILFTTRDVNATDKSVFNRANRGTLYLQHVIYRKLGMYLHELVDIEFTPMSYEAFCLSEGFRKWLFEERLGLPYPEDFEIKYANEKYYD